MLKFWPLAVALFAMEAAAAPPDKFTFVSLDPQANQKLDESLGNGIQGNDLGSLKTGLRTCAAVNFKVGEKFIQLGSKLLKTEKPNKAEGIKVDRKFAKLHILHSTEFGEGGAVIEEGTRIAEYKVNYDDGTSATIPVVYGEDVRDWWFYPNSKEATRGKVGWKGENEYSKTFDAQIRLYVLSWENPHPAKKVASITYAKTDPDSVAAPFCVAITLESK